MMSSQAPDIGHTPGPWPVAHREVTAENGEVYQHFEIGAGWKDGRYLHVSGCIDEADARLIAAAPEMLEALKIAQQFMSIASDWNIDEAEINGQMRSTYDWLDVVNKAIAKATGGTTT